MSTSEGREGNGRTIYTTSVARNRVGDLDPLDDKEQTDSTVCRFGPLIARRSSRPRQGRLKIGMSVLFPQLTVDSVDVPDWRTYQVPDAVRVKTQCAVWIARSRRRPWMDDGECPIW